MTNKLSQLSAWSKRLLNADQQKLFKAGFIDANGRPTNEGMDAMLALLWQEKEKELVVEAEKVLDLNKTEKEEAK